MAFNLFKTIGHIVNTQIHNVQDTIQDTVGIFQGKKSSETKSESPINNLLGFIGSVVASDFIKETTGTALKKSHSLIENTIFSAGIFAGSLLAGPLGGVVGGLAIRHLQNRGQDSRPLPQKAVSTAITGGAILIGAQIGAGLISGPMGLALGAAVGGMGARVVGQNLRKFTSLFTNSLLTQPTINSVNSATESVIQAITNLPSPFTAFKVAFGCLGGIVLIALFIIVVIIASFILTPNKKGTAPTPPPKTAVSCIDFTSPTWDKSTNAQEHKTMFQTVVDNLVSQFPTFINLICANNNKIIMEFEPPGRNIKYCGWQYAQNTIAIRSLKTCGHDSKGNIASVFNEGFATYFLAHELTHVYQAHYNTINEFEDLIDNLPDGGARIYTYPTYNKNNPTGSVLPIEDQAEAVGIYAGCKISNYYCGVYDDFPQHMKFVEEYIGTIE